MKTVWLPDATPRPRRLAVGEFDGVHVGHREVIRGADSVLTFEPHPRTVVAPESAPKLLTTLDQKADLIAALGVDELIVIPFDGALRGADGAGVHRPRARRSASARPRCRSARTSASAIARRATPRCWPRRTRSRPAWWSWSRSTARSCPRRTSAAWSRPARSPRPAGCSARRSGCAGSSPTATSVGARSASRPPTSSRTRALAVPDHGIYACRAFVPGLGEWTAAVSIGVRPTFVTGRGLLVEAFLLDFDGDLYGRELRLDFIERIRGEKRFDSAETLVEQMHRDVEEIARVV